MPGARVSSKTQTSRMPYRRDHNSLLSIFALAIFSDAFLSLSWTKFIFHWPSPLLFKRWDQGPVSKDALCCSVVESRLALSRPHGLHSASQAPLSASARVLWPNNAEELSPAEIIILLDSLGLSQNIWWAVCKSVWAWGYLPFLRQEVAHGGSWATL